MAYYVTHGFGAGISLFFLRGLSPGVSVPDTIPSSTGNLTAQSLTDLDDSFLRVNGGWAEHASLGADGATNIPVSGGTAVQGIFDGPTVEGGDRGGPRWWCDENDGYEIGRYITISTRGTYRIQALQPDGDGELLECLLEPIS